MHVIAILLFFIIVLVLVYACYSLVKSSGVITAYIGLSWIPLVLGIIWVEAEFQLSPLNPALPHLIIGVSFLLSLVGLPVLLTVYWKKLSASKIIGMVAAAFLHGVPAFLYGVLSITGTM